MVMEQKRFDLPSSSHTVRNLWLLLVLILISLENLAGLFFFWGGGGGAKIKIDFIVLCTCGKGINFFSISFHPLTSKSDHEHQFSSNN